jgi:hypothetical protein
LPWLRGVGLGLGRLLSVVGRLLPMLDPSSFHGEDTQLMTEPRGCLRLACSDHCVERARAVANVVEKC